MPRAAPRPCTKPGCKGYAVKDGRCDSHKREAWASSSRLSRHERGYNANWYKLRKLILLRDGYLCKPCEKAGYLTKATQVDHIINKKSGGSDDQDNLQAICDACHKIKTQSENRYGK